MTQALLVGVSDGGRCAVLIADATWRTVASVADGLQAASLKPITWQCQEVKATSVNDALIEAGLGDVPVTAPQVMA